MPSVSVSRNSKPLEGQLDISLGTVDSMKAGNDHDSVPDDKKGNIECHSRRRCDNHFHSDLFPPTPGCD